MKKNARVYDKDRNEIWPKCGHLKRFIIKEFKGHKLVTRCRLCANKRSNRYYYRKRYGNK
jgi:hypothetical protein